MALSLVRRLATAALALCAVAPAFALSACASPVSGGRSTLRFAVTTTAQDTTVAPAVRVGEVRVLSRRVNLQEPVLLGVAGGRVTVTFARRQREGATLAMDPESLEPRDATAYEYEAHAKGAAPPFLSLEPARAHLPNGTSMSCWTDEDSGRVLAQVFGADGTWIGSPVAVSPNGMDVFGAPQLVATGDRHVVAVFFVSTADGFELVAASLEQMR